MGKIKKEVKTVEIDQIIPYFDNPRVNSKTIPYLKKSIERFGYVAPIITDENHVIIIGHARYKALVKLKHKKIRILIVPMSKNMAMEYRIIDNKIQEASSWDKDLLMSEILNFGENVLEEFNLFTSFMKNYDTNLLIDDSDGLQKKDRDRIKRIVDKELKRDKKEEEDRELRQRYLRNNIVECPFCSHFFEVHLED